ncbi:MAG: SpoIIE family protein phosphatase, partial [Bdellovibrionota bacterium]
RDGDLLFWYTDGLLECANSDDKPLKKNELFQCLISALESDVAEGAPKYRAAVSEKFRAHVGGRRELEDDVTIVVAKIGRLGAAVQITKNAA